MKVLIKEARSDGNDVITLLEINYFTLNLKKYKTSGEIMLRAIGEQQPYYSSICITQKEFDEYIKEMIEKPELLDLTKFIFQK